MLTITTICRPYFPYFRKLRSMAHWCRFNLLRELIPNKEKLDKAAFLTSTMEYIKQLQVSLLSFCRRHFTPC